MTIIPGTNFMLVVYQNRGLLEEGTMLAKDYGLEFGLGRKPAYFTKDGLLYTGAPLCKPSTPIITTLGMYINLVFGNMDYLKSNTVPNPSQKPLQEMFQSEDIKLVKAFAGVMLAREDLKKLQKVWDDEAKFKKLVAQMFHLQKRGKECYLMHAVKWFYLVAELLATEDKSFYNTLDNLIEEQKMFLLKFKEILKNNSRIVSLMFGLVVQKHTFYIGNTSYQKPNLRNFLI